MKLARSSGWTCAGLSNSRDLLEQADLVAAGADRPWRRGRGRCDRRSRRRPCPSARSSDRSMVSGSGKRIDFALGGRGARDRQRPRDAVDRAVASALAPGSVIVGHARRISARNAPTGKSTRRRGHFPAPLRRLYARRNDERSTPLCSCRSATNPARPFGMDARDRACRLATNAGLRMRRAAAAGPRGAAREHGLCLGPGVAEGDARRARAPC